MLRVAIVGLLALLLGGSVALDVAPCRSILERDCARPSRVTAKGDLRVEILARKRSVSFSLATADEDLREELGPSCPKGRCGCVEGVEYLDFKGPVPAFRQINAAERAIAAKAKCSIENANVMREVRRFAVSARLVSVAAFELEYCHTCGGSCHGRGVLATYDTKDGRALAVRDFLKADAVEALQRHMLEYVLQNYTEAVDREPERPRIAKELAARSRLDDGFFVEDGVVYVDLDSFVLGCAGGPFYPVPVPAELLTPAFAASLEVGGGAPSASPPPTRPQ